MRAAGTDGTMNPSLVSPMATDISRDQIDQRRATSRPASRPLPSLRLNLVRRPCEAPKPGRIEKRLIRDHSTIIFLV
jgi:hypothetical protein